MSLSPENQIPDLYQSEPQPSKTYALHFETGEIKNTIDDVRAIEQFIKKTIKTPRYHHLIYGDHFGCEAHNLIGQGFTNSFIESEIIRMISEALIYDERIHRVYDFEISALGDKVAVSFKVACTDGILKISEVM